MTGTKPTWDPWHPDDVAAQLAGVSANWCVAGGWALDLWLGRGTRNHHDLEIAIPRPDFAAVRVALPPSARSLDPAAGGPG
jgi:hypothetical protein